MNENENKQESTLLNRNKNKFLKGLEEIEKDTVNSVLAEQFPDWDLKPPVKFVKRRRTNLV